MAVIPVLDKFTENTIREVNETAPGEIDGIIGNSLVGASLISGLNSGVKSNYLMEAAGLLEKKRREIADLLTSESGKPVRFALEEADHCIELARYAASILAAGSDGAVFGNATGQGDFHSLSYLRFPIGIVLGITPYPDNLLIACNKILPALSAGNAALLKPSSMDPLGALALRDILVEGGFPAEAMQVIVAGRRSPATAKLLRNREISMVSFTGSAGASEEIFRASPPRKFSMQVGSNCPVIVWDDSDPDSASDIIARSSFRNQGQGCLRAQRIIVMDRLEEYLVNRLAEISSGLRTGNPHDDSTDIGPLASEERAVAIENAILKDLAAGGQVITGGNRKGSILEPTVIKASGRESDLWQHEIGGPVAVVLSAGSLSEAIELANAASSGLQAGIFTSDLSIADLAFRNLMCGSVLINDAPGYRFNSIPYAGMKGSGFGTEGLRFSMEEMSVPRSMIVRR